MQLDPHATAQAETDVRWREWQARVAVNDKRSLRHMRSVMFFLVAAVTVWCVVQLT